MGNRTTHLDVLVEVLHRAELDLHGLDALALYLRRRLYGVHDRILDDGQQHASADDRVRAERHEHVREAVDAHGEVRRRVRLPLRVQFDAVPPDDLVGKLPGCVEPYFQPVPGVSEQAGEEGPRERVDVPVAQNTRSRSLVWPSSVSIPVSVNFLIGLETKST